MLIPAHDQSVCVLPLLTIGPCDGKCGAIVDGSREQCPRRGRRTGFQSGSWLKFPSASAREPTRPAFRRWQASSARKRLRANLHSATSEAAMCAGPLQSLQ